MAENVDNSDLLYETNERGETVVIKSLDSLKPVYVRFINRTSRPVDVWWRDFDGHRRHYNRMEPRTYFDIDTFVTHPWEFTDPSTKENYLINNKRIFRAPSALAGVRRRTIWFVSVCIRPLRSTVMLNLAQRLRNPDKVPALGLPRELEVDLEHLIDAILNTPPPPPSP